MSSNSAIMSTDKFMVVVNQESKPTATVHSFTVDFNRFQTFPINTPCESRLLHCSDGTKWIFCGALSTMFSFQLKYFGEESILASCTMKMTSSLGTNGAQPMDYVNNTPETAVDKCDPSLNNVFAVWTFPKHQTMYYYPLVSIEVTLSVRNETTLKCGTRVIGSHMHHDFTALREKTGTADVTLLVNEVKVAVHKAVLCARSVVFQSMFENQMQESLTSEIVLRDTNADTVNEFVTYLYSDTCKVTPERNLLPLLQIAHKYAVKGLLEMCETEFLNTVAVHNVVDFLVLAEIYELGFLKRAAIDLFAQKFQQISAEKSAELKSGVLSPSLMLEIIHHLQPFLH